MSKVCTSAQLGQVGAQLELWWNGLTESPETWDIGSSQWHEYVCQTTSDLRAWLGRYGWIEIFGLDLTGNNSVAQRRNGWTKTSEIRQAYRERDEEPVRRKEQRNRAFLRR